MNGPRIPVSTYRLQFGEQLRFNDAKNLVPYLHQLGITDVYASPLLQARRGSSHGYDVADPCPIRPMYSPFGKRPMKRLTTAASSPSVTWSDSGWKIP